MGDVENATMLLDLARQDLAAMLALRNAEDVTDQIFGFHAQQAVEKSLKAWLSILGVSYPFTHSLDTLLGLLEDEIGLGAVSQFRSLDVLSPFAVQLRYSAYDESTGQLDRDGMVRDVDKLLCHVRDVIVDLS